MLHRQEPAELIVITQPTHAWIAGCLARAWGMKILALLHPHKKFV
jgi:hypothetical protein